MVLSRLIDTIGRVRRILADEPRPARGAVMIVGMHRSGTSFLTGSLQLAGLELGNHSAWNPHNLKGNRENLDIVNFHERLLAARDMAWDRPPEGALEWTEQETADARALIAGYEGVRLWGFKDPRSLLLVHGWQKLLPELHFVGVFRHPGAVASSLRARGDMDEQRALALWRHYNARLLELHKRRSFPLLCFDEPEHELHGKLNRVIRSLGLRELEEDRFFHGELRHHEAVTGALAPELESMYRTLRALAL